MTGKVVLSNFSLFLFEVIKIKIFKHINFCLSHKIKGQKITIYDFFYIIIIFGLMVASFSMDSMLYSLKSYAVIVPLVCAVLYLLLMVTTMVNKTTAQEKQLLQYLKFTRVDVLLLTLIRTIWINIGLSVTISNVLKHWGANFYLSFLLVLLLGTTASYFIWDLITSNLSVKSKSNKKSKIGNILLTNRYTAYFYRIFFGYSKGSYEYIDIAVNFAIIILGIIFAVYVKMFFYIVQYLITAVLIAVAIDIYSIKFKSKQLDKITGVNNKLSKKYLIIIMTAISAFVNLLLNIVFACKYGLSVENIIFSIGVFIYFIPVYYGGFIIADKKLSRGANIATAFMPDVLLGVVPVVNIGISLFYIIKDKIKVTKNVWNK